MAKTAAKFPPGMVYGMAGDFKAALIAQEEATGTALLNAWADTYADVRTEYAKVLDKIAKAQAAGTPMSPAWAYQKTKLKTALATTKTQVNKYAQFAAAQTVAAQDAAVKAAAKHAAKLGSAALSDSGIVAGFTELNPQNLEHLAGFLEDGNPVAELFTGLGDQALDDARRVLNSGLALGKGPDWIARRLDDALDMPRQRAMTIARTESMRVYRAASRQTYLENANVLEGWVWHAELDERTCSACMGMDGTLHPLGSTLDGHPNCRCAMVPRTKSWEAILGPEDAKGLKDTRPPIRDGQAWFHAQSPITQRAILGPRKFSAWTRGEITLDDLVARPSNAKWGTMRRERSLSEIRAGKNANYQDRLEVRRPKPAAANPTAVKALANGNSPQAIQAILEKGGLTPQGILDHQAAWSLALKRAEYQQGPRWTKPLPDAPKVAKAVDKLKTAALTKGYPSKGYSQTAAIYKAQANGQIGAKVGVVKSLSWEQKVNAQAILAQHDEWLTGWTKAEAKTAGLAESLLDAVEGKVYGNGAAMTKAVNAAKADLNAMDDGPAKSSGLAALDAYLEGMKDAAAAVKATAKDEGTEWTHSGHGGTLVVGKDGWGKFTPASGTVTPVDPKTVQAWMGADAWKPDPPKPQPVKVNALMDQYAPGGAKVQAWDAVIDLDIDDAMKAGNPQAVANLQEAKAQIAALYPDPDPAQVAQILEGLQKLKANTAASIVKSMEDALDGGNVDAPTAATYKAALDEWKAAQAVGSPGLQDLEDLLKASPATPDVPTPSAGPSIPTFGTGPDPAKLVPTGKVLGTHGAQVYKDPSGASWLVKAPKDPKDAFLPTLDGAASQLQAASGLATPDTFIGTVAGKRQSIQRMFDAKDAFGGPVHLKDLAPSDLEVIQQHHVLDWLMSNHDGHKDQFLRAKDGSLIGIDKGQAFRWFGQDRLDWDFHPNAVYGTNEPIYNTLWREYAQGKGDMLDPSKGALGKYIASLKGMDDAEFRDLFRPYAEQAAARGKLATPQQSFPGVTAPAIPANNVDAFLDALVKRKNNLDKDFQDLYAKASKERAKHLPPPPAGAKPRPTAAQSAAGGKAALKGTEPPKPPDAPAPVKPLAETPDMQAWLEDAKARYAAFAPGKTLEGSNNWAKFKAVVEDGDAAQLDYLLDRKYITADMHKAAKDAIDVHAKAKAAQEAAYAAAMQAHKQAVKDWKEANGITEGPGDLGLADARPFTSKEGQKWAGAIWPLKNDPFWKRSWKTAIQSYTGSGHREINAALRGGMTPTATVKSLDAMMEAAPRVPEDVIVTRNMNLEAFKDKDGKPLRASRTDIVQALMQSDVHGDKGFMSSSLNNDGAMSGNVKMRLRVPAGTKAMWVSGDGTNYSNVVSSVGEREYELLLHRGTNYVIHSAKKVGANWHLEGELVPEGWTKPVGWTPKPRG